MRRFTLWALSALVAIIMGTTPAWADIDSDVVDGLAVKSHRHCKPALDKANEAAAAKGMTLEA